MAKACWINPYTILAAQAHQDRPQSSLLLAWYRAQDPMARQVIMVKFRYRVTELDEEGTPIEEDDAVYVSLLGCYN